MQSMRTGEATPVERESPDADPRQPGVSSFAGRPFAQLDVPGISDPELCRPDDVALGDHAEVIGVTLAGESRAYVVEAFAVHSVIEPVDLRVHVVNDVVGGRPVCVTHCDLTDCTRVLTDDVTSTSQALPLDLRVGGWEDGMLLMFNGRRYHQSESAIPLDDLEFETTTWQEWYAEHPETLVYTGEDCGRQE